MNQLQDLPLLVKVTEAAHILHLSRPKVYLLIELGAVTAIKLGAHYRIQRDSLVPHLPTTLANQIPKPDSKS